MPSSTGNKTALPCHTFPILGATFIIALSLPSLIEGATDKREGWRRKNEARGWKKRLNQAECGTLWHGGTPARKEKKREEKQSIFIAERSEGEERAGARPILPPSTPPAEKKRNGDACVKGKDVRVVNGLLPTSMLRGGENKKIPHERLQN